MNKFLGITLIVLAVALAVVPMFTDCQSQGKSLTTTTGKTVPMKCHWTGVAEIGVAAPLVAVGALMATTRKRNYLLGLSVLGVVLGTMAILFPTRLIGTCMSPMICATTMKSALVAVGALGIVASAGAFFFTRKEP